MPQLLRNILANYTGSTVSVLVLFFLTPFVIHSLGDEAFAVWVLIQSITFSLCFYDLGIYDAIVKYTAELDEDLSGNAEMERLVGTSLVLCGAAGIAAILTSILLAYGLVPHLDISPSLVPTVQIVMLVLGVDIAVDFMVVGFSGLLEGRQRFDVLNAVQIASRLIQALATVVLLSFGFGLVALAVLELVLSVLFLFAMALMAHVLHPDLALTPRHFDLHTWRRLRGYSVWALLSEIAAQGSNELDKLFIPAFLSLSLLTPYSVACSIAGVISMLVSPMSSAFFPFSSALGARNDRRGLEGLWLQGSRLTLALALPVAIALFFTATRRQGPHFRSWGSESSRRYISMPITSPTV